MAGTEHKIKTKDLSDAFDKLNTQFITTQSKQSKIYGDLNATMSRFCYWYYFENANATLKRAAHELMHLVKLSSIDIETKKICLLENGHTAECI